MRLKFFVQPTQHLVDSPIDFLLVSNWVTPIRSGNTQKLDIGARQPGSRGLAESQHADDCRTRVFDRCNHAGGSQSFFIGSFICGQHIGSNSLRKVFVLEDNAI